MPTTLDATAPDFDRVQREAGVATRDAMATTWLELQEERLQRQRDVRSLSQPLAEWVTLANALGSD